MTVFLSTLNQMGFLILLIAAGYFLTKLDFVEDTGAKILSKLEKSKLGQEKGNSSEEDK